MVDDNSGKAKRVIVQVKSSHVKSGDIRDLVGIVGGNQPNLPPSIETFKKAGKVIEQNRDQQDLFG